MKMEKSAASPTCTSRKRQQRITPRKKQKEIVKNKSKTNKMGQSNKISKSEKAQQSTNSSREREKTHSVNTAFGVLRTLIPTEPADRKLSKIETLRLASSYITHLAHHVLFSQESETSCISCQNTDSALKICTFCLAETKKSKLLFTSPSDYLSFCGPNVTSSPSTIQMQTPLSLNCESNHLTNSSNNSGGCGTGFDYIYY